MFCWSPSRAALQPIRNLLSLTSLPPFPRTQDLDFKALRLYPWLWRPQAELEPVPGMPQLSREERTDATEAFAAYLTERRKALYAEIAREEGANITADPEALAARQKDLEEIDTALLNCHLQVCAQQS